jgi:sodium-dependent dicarboxylate transporter 2/3/5
MSNFVTVTLVYTAMMPAAIAAGLGNPVALGFSMWYGARSALALPSATSSTAMVIGSGWVSVPFMAKYGFPLIIPMVLFFAFVCYPLGTLIFR